MAFSVTLLNRNLRIVRPFITQLKHIPKLATSHMLNLVRCGVTAIKVYVEVANDGLHILLICDEEAGLNNLISIHNVVLAPAPES